MAYDGYWRLGDVEVVNGARASAYAKNIMPTFGLEDCGDCEGLLQSLGQDEYRTPTLDGAPWVDSSNPGLDDFWGVYPLGVSGADDSTRQVTITQLMGDGAVAALPRAASREIRFDVLLVGRTERSVYEGLHWLNRALDASRCGDDTLGCTGTSLSFFSACPPSCDYTVCPDTPAEWVYGEPERINWFWNPQPYSFGTPWEPTDADAEVSQSFAVNISWDGAPANPASGAEYRQEDAFVVDGYDGPAARPAGTPVTIYVDSISVNRPGQVVNLVVNLLDAAGAPTGDTLTATLTGSTFYAATQASGVSTAPFAGFQALLYQDFIAEPWATGDYISASRFSFETESSVPLYFDGSYIGSQWAIGPGMMAYWMGSSGSAGGPSALIPEIDDINLWSVSPASSSDDNPRWAQFGGGDCPGPGNVSVYAEGPAFTDLVLTRALSGLIPGQWYRVGASVTPSSNPSSSDAPGVVVMAVAGKPQSVIFQEGPDLSCKGPEGMALWFQATSPVEYLEFRMPGQFNPEAVQSAIEISYLRVERASANNRVYQTSFEDDGTAMNGWAVGTPAGPGIRVETGRSHSGWGSASPYVRFVATSPGATIQGPEQTLIERSIRGLVPGERYVAGIEVEFNSNQAVAAPLTVGWEAGGSSATKVLDIDTGRRAVMEVEFVATQIQQDVRLYVANDYILPMTSNSVSVAMLGAWVERTDSGAVEYPDPALDYRRTLYRVTALTGPTVTERFDLDCGFMVRATFGLVAGVPDQYGPLLEAGSAFGGSSAPLQQVDCIDGQAVRTNYTANPSWETVTTGWQTYGDTTSAYVRTSAHPTMWASRGGRSGGYMAQITASGTSSLMGLREFSPKTVAARQWVGAAALIATEVTPGLLTNVFFEWGDGSSSGAVQVPAPFYHGAYVKFVAQVPEGVTSARLVVAVQDPDSNLAVGARMWVDSVITTIADSQAQALMGLEPYFDGSYPNGSWTGSAGSSISTLTPAEEGAIIDPDCPPLPTPPQAPQIDESCIDEPDSWTRYTIYIPEGVVPTFSSVVPVVTIRTGTALARQVRMRWYPNPDNLNITELPYCDYEGEVVVSYIPAQSVMEVNVIEKQATVSIQGGPERQGTHLLYGPDGGPMEWPELSCGIPYVFTVDVDASDDVDDLDVMLALGLKV